ncbi:ubiquitin thioesterase OTU1 isoform X2 [Melopsittacus undulatus]|uniref:ubiquitin thioesterase OTU1 isoform X2 n=1 Tax=Melopsittacus undulatus TaxID=13146 RepID=UPI00146F675D|nr:ubiquitin thioesterase OTU1 isoform X2 [Melopsittacus undulatus]
MTRGPARPSSVGCRAGSAPGGSCQHPAQGASCSPAAPVVAVPASRGSGGKARRWQGWGPVGDTLIVEEDTSKAKTDSPVVAKRTMSNSVREAVPVLARRVVPADNSCLFTSVYYVVEGGVYDPGCAPEMRSLIAQIVASDPESYCEAVLGKTNREYCDWIRREETWGGAIEVSILSKFYQCEICVVDTQTVRIDRFGEDAGYTKRVLLIYDGIHYDPLERKIPDSDIPPQTIFSTSDDIVLAQALELADEARRKRQFTDVNHFTLRCMVCQKGLTGQVEAREHAKETGHTNFGEV